MSTYRDPIEPGSEGARGEWRDQGKALEAETTYQTPKDGYAAGENPVFHSPYETAMSSNRGDVTTAGCQPCSHDLDANHDGVNPYSFACEANNVSQTTPPLVFFFWTFTNDSQLPPPNHQTTLPMPALDLSVISTIQNCHLPKGTPRKKLYTC